MKKLMFFKGFSKLLFFFRNDLLTGGVLFFLQHVLVLDWDKLEVTKPE